MHRSIYTIAVIFATTFVAGIGATLLMAALHWSAASGAVGAGFATAVILAGVFLLLRGNRRT